MFAGRRRGLLSRSWGCLLWKMLWCWLRRPCRSRGCRRCSLLQRQVASRVDRYDTDACSHRLGVQTCALLPSFWPDPLKPFGLVLKSFFSFDVTSSIVMSAPVLCGQKSYFERLARLPTREAGTNKRRFCDLAGSASKQEKMALKSLVTSYLWTSSVIKHQ